MKQIWAIVITVDTAVLGRREASKRIYAPATARYCHYHRRSQKWGGLGTLLLMNRLSSKRCREINR